jgi:8-hydroxy-5-deazaflavin:NADPH oxidoreductase
MKIAIIGSGNVGGALAQQWIMAGHAVVIGAKFPLSDKNISLANKIGEDKFSSVQNAVQQSDVLLIATPPTAIFEVLEQMGDVADKVIIDATNSIMKSPEPYKTIYHCLQDKTNAEIVKCL